MFNSMSDLTLPIVLVTGLLGYLFSNKDTRRVENLDLNLISENDFWISPQQNIENDTILHINQNPPTEEIFSSIKIPK